MKFDSQPIVTPYDSTHYMLIEGFYFTIDGENYWIDAGFIWDGMSIPRVFWPTIGTPFGPAHLIAGLVHDYLYRTGIVSRETADKVMYDIMIAHGNSWYASKKAYWGVRIFGIFPWRKHRKKDKK